MGGEEERRRPVQRRQRDGNAARRTAGEHRHLRGKEEERKWQHHRGEIKQQPQLPLPRLPTEARSAAPTLGSDSRNDLETTASGRGGAARFRVWEEKEKQHRRVKSKSS